MQTRQFPNIFLLKVWMDFDQTCTDVLLGHRQELITQGLKMLDNILSAFCPPLHTAFPCQAVIILI